MRWPGVIVAAVAALACLPANAGAVDAPTGWDGSNPFRCTLQQAGFGTVVPDPAADPYCVEFDKRRQNVTELGVVEFLSNEPARVAAAVPKCFYFQSDHWRGSIVQEDGSTKTYEWDGHYFFDKARAEGGAWITNFTINGRTEDPSKIPGIPAEFARHLGPGTGGVITRNDIPADPTCIEKAKKIPGGVYATPPEQRRSCAAPSGTVGRSALGPLSLGAIEADVRALLGNPARVHRGWLRYCVQGAGKLMAGLDIDRSGDRGEGATPKVVIALTSNRVYKVGAVGRGSSASAVRKAFPKARRLVSVGNTQVLAASSNSPYLIGLHRGAVRFLAVYDRTRIKSARSLAAFIRRSA